jgi:cell division septation protein DedD
MSRDQPVTTSQENILWVAGIGVGLLTLVYVLGVQVGKQSVALRQPASKSVEDELKELPEPLSDQLKIFETESGGEKLVPVKPEPEPKPAAQASEKKSEEKKEDKKSGTQWTLQLVSTSDEKEAQRVVDKAKSAGFKTRTIKDTKGNFKVRLAQPSNREAIDQASEKLKKANLKPFAVKVE